MECGFHAALYFSPSAHFPQNSDTLFIVDAADRISAVLVGRPGDSEWPKVCDEAVEILTEVREEGIASDAFLDKYLSHRRGDFVAVPTGVSFGGGQKVRRAPSFVLLNYVPQPRAVAWKFGSFRASPKAHSQATVT